MPVMPVICRYLSGDSITLFSNGTGTGFPSSATSLFVPTPPSILQLTNQQLFRSPRRTSSSSLPGRLNRALSLGTIPSLARAGKVCVKLPSQVAMTAEWCNASEEGGLWCIHQC